MYCYHWDQTIEASQQNNNSTEKLIYSLSTYLIIAPSTVISISETLSCSSPGEGGSGLKSFSIWTKDPLDFLRRLACWDRLLQVLWRIPTCSVERSVSLEDRLITSGRKLDSPVKSVIAGQQDLSLPAPAVPALYETLWAKVQYARHELSQCHR